MHFGITNVILSYFFAGVLLWEIFTGGEMPYASTPTNVLMDMICNRNKRLSKPPKSPESIFSIMSICWSQVGRSNICNNLDL